MNTRWRALFAAFYLLGLATASSAPPFEGQIDAVLTRGEQVTPLLYTIGAKALRLETAQEKSVEPVDLVDLESGALTILFPHNQSFVRVPMGAVGKPAPPPRPAMPAAGAQLPALPPIPAPPRPKAELKPTGKKEKILGFDCEQWEIIERGETVEIWATAALVPFRAYVREFARRFGPGALEDAWGEQLTARKLFPLRAVLHDETPNERFRFEVKSIKPGKIADEQLFQPPPGYTELNPPSF